MVYCAASLALAALEVMVHLPPGMRHAGGFPPLVAVGLEVPDDGLDPDVASLPPDYGIPDCQALGDAWILAGQSLGLWVPSRVIPLERNLLLNPAHPAMQGMTVVLREAFRFDDRLGS
jgi:hypothetical protein